MVTIWKTRQPPYNLDKDKHILYRQFPWMWTPWGDWGLAFLYSNKQGTWNGITDLPETYLCNWHIHQLLQKHFSVWSPCHIHCVKKKKGITKAPQKSYIRRWWRRFYYKKCSEQTKTSGVTDSNWLSIHFGWKSEGWAHLWDLSINELT